MNQTINQAARQRERRIALLVLALTLVLLAMPGSVLSAVAGIVQPVTEPLISSLKAWKASWWPWPSSDNDGGGMPLDKLAHFLLFACCGYWVTRGWLGVYSWPGLLLALLAYGVLTEIIQVFVPGRGLSVGDMIADAFGASFGVLWALRHGNGNIDRELK